MSVDKASFDFESAIRARLIQAPISPEAARYLGPIDFGDADHARMQELMEKSNDGALTTQETAELDGYVNIANVLSVMHTGFRSMRRSFSAQRR